MQGTTVNHPSKMLTSMEVHMILAGLVNIIEDFEQAKRALPFNASAKKDVEEMLNHAKSAKAKLEHFSNGGKEFTLPEYEEGDEKEFLK